MEKNTVSDTGLRISRRLEELAQERLSIWLELQNASPENGECALLEIELHESELEISELRGEIARAESE